MKKIKFFQDEKKTAKIFAVSTILGLFLLGNATWVFANFWRIVGTNPYSVVSNSGTYAYGYWYGSAGFGYWYGYWYWFTPTADTTVVPTPTPSGWSSGGGGGWSFYNPSTTVTTASWVVITTTGSWVTITTPNWVKITFKDISTSFAKDDIAKLVGLWVIKGYADGTFKPNNGTTRAEFLGMLMKALNLSLPATTKTSFSDVKVSWQVPYAEAAKAYGIKGQTIGGKSVFRPNDYITRAEALAMLFSVAKIKTDSTIKTVAFKDVSTSWMIPYIAKAKELGIVSGQTINGKLVFRPNDSITRAETARVITKSLNIK